MLFTLLQGCGALLPGFESAVEHELVSDGEVAKSAAVA
jgi:hypothetical protein